jgi:hypothetical protein
MGSVWTAINEPLRVASSRIVTRWMIFCTTAGTRMKLQMSIRMFGGNFPLSYRNLLLARARVCGELDHWTVPVGLAHLVT